MLKTMNLQQKEVVKNLCQLQRKSSLTLWFFPFQKNLLDLQPPFSVWDISSIPSHWSAAFQANIFSSHWNYKQWNYRIFVITIMLMLLRWASSGKNTDTDVAPNATIKPVLDKFYHVRYTFEYEKGGTNIKVLPAMCERNDLEEHLFVFLKCAPLIGFTYALTKENKVWIHEDGIAEELATPELTWHGNQCKFSVDLWINNQMD